MFTDTLNVFLSVYVKNIAGRKAWQMCACCPLRPFLPLWILTLSLCQGPSGPLFPVVLWCPSFSWSVLSLRRALVFVCPAVGRPAGFSGHLGRRSPTWLSGSLGDASGVRGLASCRGACPTHRALASPFALSLPSLQGRSQRSSWLHLAQPAWSHGVVRQELSCGSA